MTTESAFSRRELLKRLGMAGAAAMALPELSRVLLFQREVLARQTPSGGAVAQAQTLNPAELATLAAVCARIIPSDANGPGATEARASQYIDRALGGWPPQSSHQARSVDGSRPRETRTPRGWRRLTTPRASGAAADSSSCLRPIRMRS